ncbi:MAG: 4Fe-4S single cluster domain-containing protein [Verrucomicrobiia bacterium]
MKNLKIHNFLPRSYANGPGARAVIWMQGCSLGCPGCYNPQTHSPDGGRLVSMEELRDNIVKLGNSIEGITISGGEPLEQAAPLSRFLKLIKTETRLSVILFTGYEWKELEDVLSGNNHPKTIKLNHEKEALQEILNSIDVLIAGRFIQSKRLARDLRGSSNKTFHFFTTRYTSKDFESVPEAEIVITPDGKLLISGINPPNITL